MEPHRMDRAVCAGLLVLVLSAGHALAAQDWSGNVSLETRTFLVDATGSTLSRVVLSPSAQPEYVRSWGAHRLRVSPFFRVDSADPARTHFDLRELLWQTSFSDWELRAGVGRVFWGVTESQHLVDVINQTDFVENIDGEDKLGQPMVNVAFFRDWGNLDLFVLPGFRKRTFPGPDGRLRSAMPVATDQARFDASSGNKHVDLAIRWSHFLGVWDVGLSHFYGTNREPELIPGLDPAGNPVLIPFYDIVHQTGLDVQATLGAWLWKVEAISRGGSDRRFSALTGGFEYTFTNLSGTGLDLGVLAEYLFDERQEAATNPFEDDVFVAARFELNDAQTSRVLAGVLIDRSDGSSFVNIEGSRRLRNSWIMTLEGRLFVGIPDDDLLSSLRNDDHVQVEIAWYF